MQELDMVTKPTHSYKPVKVSHIINTVFHPHIYKIFLCMYCTCISWFLYHIWWRKISVRETSYL